MRIRSAALALLALVAVTPARAGESGELRCSIAGGVGFVVAGKRATSCVYYRRDGSTEFYIGSFTRIGIDIGPAQARSAVFAVSVPAAAPPGALDGDYAGLGAGGTLGRGLAAEALVGGRGGSVQIAPIANSRLTGLNFEGGLGELHLRYAGMETRRERYRSDKPDSYGF